MNAVSRALSAVIIIPIRGYQRFVSPLRPPTCRFYPSCSAYAVDALRLHGPFVGLWLAIRRLGRCHPWTPGGVDHVPPPGQWRSVRPPYDPGAASDEAASHEHGDAEEDDATGPRDDPEDSGATTRSHDARAGASSLTLWPAWHRVMTAPRASLNRGRSDRPTPAPGA